MSGGDFYDTLAETYDLLISWKRRLAREKPFFRRIFREMRVRRVLDTACGTGMHAIAFHDWGYHVTGCDISPGMVAKARENAGSRPIEFFRAGFTELDESGGMYDAVTCLGNSLPHVLDDDELDRSLECMKSALLPGGILVIHGNNYDRIIEKQERFMPLAEGERKGKSYLFVRFFDFLGDTLTFNVITLTNKSGRWGMYRDASTHRALTCALLEERLKKAGFLDIRVWGGYPDEPYDRMESDNLIVVAQKPHNEWSNPRGEPVSAIDRVPIHETGEPLVDVEEVLRDAGVRDKPALLRKRVAEMLAQAESLLPPGYRFYIKCAYRSIARQTEMYQGLHAELSGVHPEWPESRIRREINKYLAPPDAKHPPGHSTGAAVDLTILGPDGVELDMVSAVCPEENNMATFPTYSRCITPAAAKSRELLVDIMTGAGFSNYPGEWWHWSYGDSAWAVRVNAPYALYGAAEN